MIRSVDDFIKKALEINSISGLNSCFLQTMRCWGFEHVLYVVLTDHFRPASLSDAIRLDHVPPSWLGYYAREKAHKYDPVLAEVKKRHLPFNLFELEETGTLADDSRKLFQMLRQLGLKDGYAVPVYLRPGDMAYFALGTGKAALDFSTSDLLEIHAICQQMHLRYIELAGEDEAPQLSRRERQVLECIACGKSNSVIAHQLGISRHTVDTLVRRCFAKLGVSSRVEAVLGAMSHGLILP